MRLPKILISKKIFFLTLSLLFFCFLAPKTIFAYTPPEGSYEEQFSGGLNSDAWEKSSFDFATINNVMESVTTMIVGSSEEELNQKLGSSALKSTANLIGIIYQRPAASSVQYFADLGERLKINQPVYAQGIGYEGLKSIMGLWKSFRNSAYVVFAIILVFIGFAVMFRLKINPQTVVTFQSAIPKIIVTLILITFSYAIAGFLIDLIYVFIFLFSSLIGKDININNVVFMEARNILGGYYGSVDTIGLEIRKFANELMGGMGIPGLGKLIGVLGKMVLSVAVIVATFKLFFTLLISYISILAGVIFSPWMLMLEAVPGQKGLMNWLKMMMTNILPFPIVAIMFMVGAKIIENLVPGGPETAEVVSTTWVAPFLGMGSTNSYIASLIGIAIILATPSVIASVQKSIGTPGIAGMAGGIIAPITTAWGGIRGAAVGAAQSGWKAYQQSPYKQEQRVYKEEKLKRQIGAKLDAEGLDNKK